MAALSVSLVAGALTVAAPAAANHISGATYGGTHGGGGTVEFTLAADGSKLTNLKVSAPFPPCGSGDLEFFDAAFPPSSIANHSFSYTQLHNLDFVGSFGSVQGASGTLQFSRTSPSSCTSPTFDWTATTTSAPPPACSDLADNDGDGKVDFPADPGCTDASDGDETDPAGPGGGTTPPGPGGGTTPPADSEACANAEDDVSEAEEDVAAAKKAVRKAKQAVKRATGRKAKSKAKAKLKRKKKTLANAKDDFEDARAAQQEACT